MQLEQCSLTVHARDEARGQMVQLGIRSTSTLFQEMQLAEPEPSPLFDAKSLAGYLRVSTRTLENIIQRGEGPPYVRLGRQRRWRPADVEVWLKECTQRSRKGDSRSA